MSRDILSSHARLVGAHLLENKSWISGQLAAVKCKLFSPYVCSNMNVLYVRYEMDQSDLQGEIGGSEIDDSLYR